MLLAGAPGAGGAPHAAARRAGGQAADCAGGCAGERVQNGEAKDVKVCEVGIEEGQAARVQTAAGGCAGVSA